MKVLIGIIICLLFIFGFFLKGMNNNVNSLRIVNCDRYYLQKESTAIDSILYLHINEEKIRVYNSYDYDKTFYIKNNNISYKDGISFYTYTLYDNNEILLTKNYNNQILYLYIDGIKSVFRINSIIDSKLPYENKSQKQQ